MIMKAVKTITKPLSVISVMGVLLLALVSWADDHEELLKEDHPDSHLVEKGDTLWDISNRFLKNPWMWPEIWHVNPQIENPHLIYPGDVVKLIYLDGSPRLTVKRGDAARTYKMSPGSSSTSGKSGDVKLEPSIHVMPLEDPIPAIPLDVIDPFLTSSRIVTPGELKAAPYVIQGAQRHVITGAGGELYARGQFEDGNSIYGVFREGKVFTDPVTNEVLGVQAIDIGTGKIKSLNDDIARLSIVRTTQEVRIKDRLLINEERRVDSIFYPSSPDEEISGEILDVEGGVSQIGYMSVVVINKGERENLENGNVLAIYQKGESVRDPITDVPLRLPDERAGLLMIFATFEKLSYGLVLFADRPLLVGDIVKQP